MKEAIYKVWLPAAIKYGINYDTFWKLNPAKMDIYQDVFIENRKEEYNKIDYVSWLQGRYISEAIGSCFSKIAKYPMQPYSYKNLEQNENISDELRAEIAAKKFEAYAEVFNRKFESRNQ